MPEKIARCISGIMLIFGAVIRNKYFSLVITMFALNPPCKLRLGVGDVVSRNVIWVIQVKIVDIDRRVLPLSIGGRPDAFLNTS